MLLWLNDAEKTHQLTDSWRQNTWPGDCGSDSSRVSHPVQGDKTWSVYMLTGVSLAQLPSTSTEVLIRVWMNDSDSFCHS